MLSGIAFMILGVFLQIEPENDWHGRAYIFAILGFLLVLIGQFKEVIMKMIDRE